MAHDPGHTERDDQDEVEREDREASGGDAEAAGTVEERERVAADEDDLFDGDDDE